MARSYGYEHFKAPKSGEPRPRRGKKPSTRARAGGRQQGGQGAVAQLQLLQDAWSRVGLHAQGARAGAEAALRSGIEILRVPLDLVRSFRTAR